MFNNNNNLTTLLKYRQPEIAFPPLLIPIEETLKPPQEASAFEKQPVMGLYKGNANLRGTPAPKQILSDYVRGWNPCTQHKCHVFSQSQSLSLRKTSIPRLDPVSRALRCLASAPPTEKQLSLGTLVAVQVAMNHARFLRIGN